MVILDPATWKPIQIFKMRERDDHPRTPSANVGFEDMRIFKTDRGGLQGIAASLHLQRDTRPAAGGAQHQPPEQVLLSFDSDYNIVAARPIRGDSFSGTAQKNWVPFDDCAEPRFLYSIGKGTMFSDRGAVHGDAAVVRLSERARALVAPAPNDHAQAVREDHERAAQDDQAQQESERIERIEQAERSQREHAEKERVKKESAKKSADPRTRLAVRGTDVSVVRGRRLTHDTVTSRPSYVAGQARLAGTGRVNTESSRNLTSGRTLMPRYEGLRGGTQLVRVAEDTWLGIGHEMRFVRGLKYYFHVWYTTNSRGKLMAASEQMKLASEGIEFAAGMAIDGERIVVSFGVDDMKSMLGETTLSAVLESLKPIKPIDED